MNQDDKTLFQNDASIVSPPPIQPQVNQPLNAEESNSGVKVAAILGAVGLSSLAAWGLYEYISSGAEDLGEQLSNLSDVANNTEMGENLAEGAQPPQPTVVNNVTYVHRHPHLHHVNHHEAADEPDTAMNDDMGGGLQDRYFQMMEMDYQGRPAIVALGYTNQGSRVMLVDADHDGTFDYRYVDPFNDGSWQASMDFREEGIDPPSVLTIEDSLDRQGIEPTYSYRASLENDGNGSNEGGDVSQGDHLELARLEYLDDGNGNTMEVATVRYGRQEVRLVDADGDGQYDFMARDLNHDGVFQNDEMRWLDNPIEASTVYDIPPTEDFEDPNAIYADYHGLIREEPPVEEIDGVDGIDVSVDYDDNSQNDGKDSANPDDDDPNARFVSIDEDEPHGYYDENVGVYEHFDDETDGNGSDGLGVDVLSGDEPHVDYDENVGVYEQFDNENDNSGLVEVDTELDNVMVDTEQQVTYVAQDVNDYDSNVDYGTVDNHEPEAVDVADTYHAPEVDDSMGIADHNMDYAPDPDPGIDTFDV